MKSKKPLRKSFEAQVALLDEFIADRSAALDFPDRRQPENLLPLISGLYFALLFVADMFRGEFSTNGEFYEWFKRAVFLRRVNKLESEIADQSDPDRDVTDRLFGQVWNQLSRERAKAAWQRARAQAHATTTQAPASAKKPSRRRGPKPQSGART